MTYDIIKQCSQQLWHDMGQCREKACVQEYRTKEGKLKLQISDLCGAHIVRRYGNTPQEAPVVPKANNRTLEEVTAIHKHLVNNLFVMPYERHLIRLANYRECEYMGAHKRVERYHGKASLWCCYHCGIGADEWGYNNAGGEHERISKQKGHEGIKYSVNFRDYWAMCTTCHKAFDKKHREEAA